MAEQFTGIESLLLDIAHPDLYRLNAFRITELPMDAEARDISRRQAAIKQATVINVAIPPGYGCALQMEEGVDPDRLSQTVQRLGDPERRLIDEVFWFWPRQMGKSREDEALLTLGRGEIDRVYNRWQQLRDDPKDEGCALHNLAILCHAQALDWERTVRSRKLVELERMERDKCWREAFICWKKLLESEAFWSQVTARIRGLDDPRLTTGMVQRIRIKLPQVLLLINAHLALEAAERNDVDDCNRQLNLLYNWEFEDQAIGDALHTAVEPIVERIKGLCKQVETQFLADPDKADGVVRSFLDQSEPILNMLDMLLEDDAVRDGIHDGIASVALDAAISYGNETGDWSTVLPLVDRLQPLAVGALTRDRIESERAVMQMVQIGEPIRIQCERAKTDSMAAPGKAADVVRSLLDEAEPVLKTLDEVLLEDNTMRDMIHDGIASVALDAAIRYGNETGDWSTVLLLVDRLQPLAVGESALDYIESQRAVIHGNQVAQRSGNWIPPVPDFLDNGLCWYCQAWPAEVGAEYNVTLYAHLASRLQQDQDLSVTVPVLRCDRCKQLHNKTENFTTWGVLIGGVFAIVSIILIILVTMPGNLLIALLILPLIVLFYVLFHKTMLIVLLLPLALPLWLGGSLGAFIGKLVFVRPENIRDLRDVEDITAIRGRLSQGWYIGT